MIAVASSTVEVSEPVLRERFFQATNYHSIPGGRKKLDYLFSVARRLQSERLTPGTYRSSRSAKSTAFCTPQG